MIGIVVVSHSDALARAAVDLALQMGGDAPPTIEIAAGVDGGFGTDAVAIAAAIDRASGEDGVLVVMDLGSAILSTEMATEFASSTGRVVLSPAPFVEGLIAAVVLAAAGADLDTVAAEARDALSAKHDQLGPPEPAAADLSQEAPADAASEEHFDAVIDNPSGLHARPAALFVKAASRHDAIVELADLDRGGPPVPGRSLIALMALGVRPGTRVRVSASGPEARAALDELRALVEDGFGER
ncbi:HPr family phosphocarrier protein [Microbacterium sp. Gd 4-13]|uniref:HPr family phosphocarrier protein n=1 Tax=Microbacterium sp. Gd 4-13 TaxID=2173179 RepID=UPI000D5806B4|nr:HPr family phosphocarrier protein [Microbacterium sp. Gd 4-13]PVW04663.1 HPr family phosphocarrier protein [Microbacterium sp. Gd 4-13]